VQHPNQYELVYQACLRYAALHDRPIEVSTEPPPDVDITLLPASPTATPVKMIKKLEGHISSDEEEDEPEPTAAPELPRGKEERVRRNFVDHVQQPWFHGVMSRETAEEICKASGMREGSHVVRESPNTPGQYVITLVSEGVVYHNRVIYKNEQFRTTRTGQPTISAILTHYSTARDDFQTALAQPILCQRSRTLSIVSSLNERELELMALPVNAQERATLPKKLSQMETRKAGWLFKQGGGRDVGAFSLSGKSGGLFARKNWKNRFFVLQDTMIKYYKTEIHTGREEALGYINLSADSILEVLTDRSFSIQTNRRTYFMYSDRVEAAREWIEMLESAIKRVKSSTV